MRCLLYLLLFDFALTSEVSEQLPIINITITRNPSNVLQSEIPPNCCVINYAHAFKVIVYMPNNKKTIECFDAKDRKNIILSEKLRKDSGGGYSVTIPKATAIMATEWQCKLSLSSPVFTRSFKVHVRGQKLGFMHINNNNIVIYSTEFTTLDYDEYAIHHYIDGEMTLFRCFTNKYSSNLQILYQNEDTDEQLKIVEVKKEAVLNLRLTKEHNNRYLDCKITEKKEDGTISSNIRVFFQKRNTLDVPRFMINKMVLTPVSQSNTEYYNPNNPRGTFFYNYFNREKVVIRTLTGNNYSSLSCSNDQAPSHTVKDISLKTTLTEHNNNLMLRCTMNDNRQKNDDTMTLKLKYVESTDFYPMSGLSWADILAKYKTSNKDVVIKYSYRGNRLLLTCNASDTGLQWDFEPSEIKTENVKQGYDVDSGQFWETKSFEMKPNCSRTTIKCYVKYGRSAEVELIQDSPLQFDNIRETDSITEYFSSTQSNNITNSEAANTHTDIGDKSDNVTVDSTPRTNGSIFKSTETNEENPEDNPYKVTFFQENFKLLLLCATIILAIIVIAITVCLIMKLFKQKRKEQAHSSNINYENLPEHNDGPMPIPQQWQCNDDDVMYSTPGVEKSIDNLYAKPLPKSLRPLTPIYAEAIDHHTNKSEADYTNTGRFVKKKANELKDNNNYSEVYQSKKVVNSDSDNIKYANIDQINETYAQVEPKTFRESDNIVSLKEHIYGNTNETDNQLSNHHSEPAYAEIRN